MMNIPDSISAMVHTMSPVLWTLMVWTIALAGYCLMAVASEQYIPVAFAATACLLFVGSMPLIGEEGNILHWAFGILGCALTQLWCLLVLTSAYALLLWWTAYAVVLVLMAIKGCLRTWCFWLETWCMLAVAMTLILNATLP